MHRITRNVALIVCAGVVAIANCSKSDSEMSNDMGTGGMGGEASGGGFAGEGGQSHGGAGNIQPSGGSAGVTASAGGGGRSDVGGNGQASGGKSAANGGSTDAGNCIQGSSNESALAYDGIDYPTTNSPTGLKGGNGWSTQTVLERVGWINHHPDEANHWFVADTTPLVYLNLKTSGRYFRHDGDAIVRAVDPSNTFANWQTKVGDRVLIGKDDTTLWLSVLLRAEGMKVTGPIYITTSRSNVPYYSPEFLWAAGVAPNKTGGSAKWSIFKGAAPRPAHYAGPSLPAESITWVSSDKVMLPAVTSLLVIELQFRSGLDTVNLYVDPPCLGGEAPAKPDVTAQVDAAFNAVASGYQDERPGVNIYSMDELRIGTSFASVTPIQ